MHAGAKTLLECAAFVEQLNSIFVILPVPHVDEGKDAVEGGHEDVRHGQVQQEVVGHAPHPPVSWKESE